MKTTYQTITLKCGHTEEFAGNLLGRGRARLDRIKNLESHLCHKCHLTNVRKVAASLTRLDGTPYTAEEQDAYVHKHI